jgi:transcription factor IIIB 90 kDa subunit
MLADTTTTTTTTTNTSSKCPSCGAVGLTDTDEASGTVFCTGCGRVFEENMIVATVGFIEGTNGRTQAMGAQVNASYSNFGTRSSAEMAVCNARTTISQFAASLGVVRESPVLLANRIYSLAFAQGLTRGRRVARVCAVCLYIALRRESIPVMLIELADMVHASVFKLGALFMRLRREFSAVVGCVDVDPSVYIARFAAALGFGELTRAITADALRLVRRMKRDWIAAGRRPAGICGASLLLAARIHGVSVSIHDIVAVIKMSDRTVYTRVREFKATPAATLPVAEFRRRCDIDENNEGGEQVYAQLETDSPRKAIENAATNTTGHKRKKLKSNTEDNNDNDNEVNGENAAEDAAKNDVSSSIIECSLPPSFKRKAEYLRELSEEKKQQQSQTTTKITHLPTSVVVGNTKTQEGQKSTSNLPNEDPFMSLFGDPGPMESADARRQRKRRRKLTRASMAGNRETTNADGTTSTSTSNQRDPLDSSDSDSYENDNKNRGGNDVDDEDAEVSAKAAKYDFGSCQFDFDNDEEVANAIVSNEEYIVRSAVWNELNRDFLKKRAEKRLQKESQMRASADLQERRKHRAARRKAEQEAMRISGHDHDDVEDIGFGVDSINGVGALLPTAEGEGHESTYAATGSGGHGSQTHYLPNEDAMRRSKSSETASIAAAVLRATSTRKGSSKISTENLARLLESTIPNP